MRSVATIYKAKGADLGVPPELLATNDIFTQHKNLLEHCRWIHRGEPPPREALELTLDALDEVMVSLRELVEDRYA
jgi:hypothetical protein